MIVGAAEVRVSALTGDVQPTLERDLERAGSAAGGSAGESAGREFGTKFGETAAPSAEKSMGEAGKRGGTKFGEEARRTASAGADAAGGEFAEKFGTRASRGMKGAGSSAAITFTDEFGNQVEAGGRGSGDRFGGGFETALRERIGNIKPIKIPHISLAFADIIGAGIAPLLGTLTAVGAGAFAMAGQVAHGTAALGALAGALGQASAAAVALPVGMLAVRQASIVTNLAMYGVGDAVKAFVTGADNAQEKLDALSPSARAFAQELITLNPIMEDLRETAAAGLFPGVTEGLRSILPLTDMVRGAVSGTAQALGGLAASAGALAAGPLAGPLQTILSGNVTLITSFGTALLGIANIATRVLAAAQPMVQVMGVDLVAAVGRWVGIATQAQESGDLSALFMRAYDTLKILISILGNVGSALQATLGAGVDTGREMLSALDDLTGRWATWARSFEGQNVIRGYFESAWDAMKLLGGVLANVIVTFQNLSAAAAPAGTALMTALEGVTQRWRDFTGSIEGQNQLRDYFNAMVPITEEFGRLIADVAGMLFRFSQLPGNEALLRQIRDQLLPAVERLLTAMANTGLIEQFVGFLVKAADTLTKFVAVTGAAQAILATLNGVLEVLNVLLEIPGVGQLILVATTLAGIGAVLTPLIGLIKGLGASFWLLNAAWSATVAVATASGRATIANTVATTAQSVATKAAAVASGVMTAAQWLLNAALTANPIGIVVVAIGALVAAFVIAYQNSDKFREIVTRAFDAVKTAVTATLDWFKGPFVEFWKNLPQFFSDLWGRITSGATSAWDGLTSSISSLNDRIGAFFTSLPGKVTGWLSSLGSTVRTGAATAWDNLTSALSTAWDATISFVSTLPQKIAYGLGALAGTVASTAINMWRSLLTTLETTWDTVTKFIADFPKNLTLGFQIIGTTIRDRATEAWKNLSDAVSSAWDAVFTYLTELPGRLREWFDRLAVNLAVWAILGWRDIRAGVATSWDDAIAWLQGVPGRVGNFFTGLGSDIARLATAAWSGLTDAVSKAFTTVYDFMSALPGRIMGFLADAGNWLLEGGKNIIQGLWQGIQNAWNSTVNLIKGIWDSFIKGFTDAFQVASPSRLFDQFGRWLLEGLLAGLQAIQANVTGFFKNLWDTITQIVTNAWNAIQRFFDSAFQTYIRVFSDTWNTVSKFFSDTWNNIQTTARNLWDAIANFFTTAFTNYVNAFRTVWTNVRDLFSQLWTNIKDIATQLWNTISQYYSGVFATYTTFFRNTWTTIRDTFTQLWTNLKDAGVRIWNELSSFFSGAFSTFSRTFTDTWTRIRDSFSTTFGGIKAIAERVWSDVRGVFASGVNLVVRAPNWVVDSINKIFGTSIGKLGTFAFAKGGTPADQIRGRVSGVGGQTADRVMASLSPEEHVWSAREVRGAGGHEVVRRMRDDARAGRTKDATASYAATMRKAATSGTLNAFRDGGFIPRLATGGELFAAVKAQFPRAKANSLYRAGDNGYHGRNMAVDLGEEGFAGGSGRPYLAAMKRWLVDNYGRANEIIYNGTGNDRTNIKNGAGFAYSSAIQNQHRNHVHFAHAGSVGSARSSGLAGIGNAIGDAVQAVFSFADFDRLAGAVKNGAKALIPGSPDWVKQMGGSVLDKAWDGVRNLVTNVLGGGNQAPAASSASAAPAGSGVQRWAGTVQAALARVGQPASLTQTVLRRMNQESGGNPRAINNWDINAKRGTPSKGLMQVIDPTFAANRDRGLSSDIYDPMANIVASMNYAMKRYGNLSSAYNRAGGYDNGGWLMPGVTLMQNNTGSPEAVIPNPVNALRKAVGDVFNESIPDLVLMVQRETASDTQSIFAEMSKLAREVSPPSTAPAASQPAPFTIAEGAFSVTIAGNADAVTVDDLSSVLAAWAEQIIREFESRS